MYVAGVCFRLLKLAVIADYLVFFLQLTCSVGCGLSAISMF